MIKILIHTYLIILLLLIIYYEHVQLRNKFESEEGCFCIKRIKRYCFGLLYPKIILLLIILFTTFTEKSLRYFSGSSIFVNTYMILSFMAYIMLILYYGIIAADIFANNMGYCNCANTRLSSIIYYLSIFAIIFIFILSINTFQFFFVHNYR